VVNRVAYGIYTSGSTGTPKRVAIGHRSLRHYVHVLAQRIDLSPDDRMLHTASPVFSAAMRQLLVPLATGAAVVLAESDDLREPARLWRLMHATDVTILDTVPAYLERLVAVAGPPLRLRLALTTGEPLRRSLVARARNALGTSCRMINLYGQTETTGSIAAHEVATSPSEETVPLGSALPGTRITVRDARLEPVARGIRGEICVEGEALALGYEGRAELTAQRFVPCPDGRLYRTGDIGVERADGVIEFVGRVDHQVKVRGIRVELGEIEHHLADHPAVRRAAVTVVTSAGGDAQLGAYLEASGARVAIAELRSHLRERLPEALVPSRMVWLDALPTSPSGKLSRLDLPPLAAEAGTRRSEPPTTELPAQCRLEQLIAAEWERVTGAPAPANDDDFFERGGDSLQAVDLIASLQEKLPAEAALPLTILFFQSPCIRDFTAAILAEADPAMQRAIVRQLGGEV
jgi:acyl-coenzyme A synthetase/AMP-(fatty) acid ligase